MKAYYIQLSPNRSSVDFVHVNTSAADVKMEKYQFSYDHWSQASSAQPVLKWVTPFLRVVRSAAV